MNNYKIEKCEDTGKLALYRHVNPNTWVLLLHEEDFEILAATLNPFRPLGGDGFRTRLVNAISVFEEKHQTSPTKIIPGRDLAREMQLAGPVELGHNIHSAIMEASRAPRPAVILQEKITTILGIGVDWGASGEYRLE